jgi:predicted nucleic acid-binding protein
VERLILDCSVMMAWALSEKEGAWMDRVVQQMLSQGVSVPAMWSLEVVNVALDAVKKGRMTERHFQVLLTEIQSFPITVDRFTHERALSRIAVLAKRHGLTSYDAAYLELAIRQDGVLATLDQSLAKAARAEGILVVPS